jgi:hypothetical protein
MRIVAIYEPPKPGLPYLLASFSDNGAEVLQARDKSAARELVVKLNAKPKRPRKGARRSPAEAS